MDSVLEDIRSTESNASKNIEDAKKRNELIISKSKEKDANRIKFANEELEKEIQGRHKSKEEELKKLYSDILKKVKAKTDELEKKAEHNMKEAVDLVLKKFEEEIE